MKSGILSILFTALLFFVVVQQSHSQELQCDIQVQTPGIQGIDPSIFESFKESVKEFMNNRKWSGYNFKFKERIEATLVFTFDKVNGDLFKGSLNIVLQRPVYNSNYKSTTLNLSDKNILFRYTPTQRMDFIENSYTNNLTSLLAYYAYLMIGIDFDTFSKNGGTQFYQKANAVVTSAQSEGGKGWNPQDGQKTRYHLVNDLLNNSYDDLRIFYYNYHRLALDIMYKEPEKGRAKIAEDLKLLKKVYSKRPGLYLLQVIIETKRDEMINIFKEGEPDEKDNFVKLMTEIDPANSSKYKTVLK